MRLKLLVLFAILSLNTTAAEQKDGEVVQLNKEKFIGATAKEDDWVTTVYKIHSIPDTLYHLPDSALMKAYRSGETVLYEYTEYSYTNNLLYDLFAFYKMKHYQKSLVRTQNGFTINTELLTYMPESSLYPPKVFCIILLFF